MSIVDILAKRKVIQRSYTVDCTYCAHRQQWIFERVSDVDEDIDTLSDALRFDLSYVCDQCGNSVRLKDAIALEGI